MEFSNELIAVSKRYFPLRARYSSRFVKKPARTQFRAKKGYGKPPMGRFVIAQYMAYVWAKKKGIENEDLAKALGYGVALIVNCVKKAGWKMGWGESKYGKFGHPSGLPKIGETYEEQIIQNAEDMNRYPIISLGRWDFVIDKTQNRICSAKFRYKGKIEWWNANDFEKYGNKISESQKAKLLELIKKEWENLSADEISYNYCKRYAGFWQFYMDKFGWAIA